MEVIRLVLISLFLLVGMFIFSVATLGLFRFKYVLNRAHAVAKCDSMAAMMTIIACIIANGFNFVSAKFIVLLFFIWLTSPVESHLIVQTEVLTNPNLEDEMEVMENDIY